MSNAQSDTVGLLIVLALLLLFLNPKIRGIWPILFTHHEVKTDFNPLSGLSLNLPGGQKASVVAPPAMAVAG